MYISLNNILTTRSWWTFGNIRKYLHPIKTEDTIEYYDIDDVIVVETLEDLKILRHNIRLGSIKSGAKNRNHNIANLIEVVINEDLDIGKAKKKLAKYLKSIKNKFNPEVMSHKRTKQKLNLLSHIRHNYTNYEEIIYYKLDELGKKSSFDKNEVVKILKNIVNISLKKKFSELKKC
jgi:hypothetical protein